jgi:hypothetical protein
MSEWQPIETAPRDGTEVIGYTTYSVFNIEFVSFKRGYWQDRMSHHFDPDFWMPLPPQPKTKRKKEKGIRDVYKFVVDATEKEIANKKHLKEKL